MSVSRFYTRVLPVLILLVIVASAAFAFAASNTVTTSYAGDGSGTVSGYNVTVVYTLNNSNPSTIDAVALTLDNSAETVRVRVNGGAGGTSWINCTGAGSAWSCNLTGTAVSTLTSLQVVAAE